VKGPVPVGYVEGNDDGAAVGRIEELTVGLDVGAFDGGAGLY